MVPRTAIEDYKLMDSERAASAAENADIEDVTGVDANITGVNPIEIKITWTTCLSSETMEAVTHTMGSTNRTMIE